MGVTLSEGCSTAGSQELDAVSLSDILSRKPVGRDTAGFFVARRFVV